MNTVSLIGRLTKDPEVRYGAVSQTVVARFSIAIGRGRNNKGEDLGTDYPPIICFGRTAELVEKFLGKGRLVGITGRIQTGKYEKDGKTHYTTEVLAERVEFLDRAQDNTQSAASSGPAAVDPPGSGIPTGFTQLTDDDIPF